MIVVLAAPSSMDSLRIRGARTHNLRNVDVDLPRNRLIVITGLSGSGKSSLAFDTIYAEGPRRYVESLSSYARPFLQMMDKPDVDSIEGLSPAIAIEQKATSHNPRSTVGTVTEIHDYLRLLYARVGIPRCPEHGVDLAAQTVSQMVDQVLRLPDGETAMLLAPCVSDRRGEHNDILDELSAQGFVRARIDGKVVEIDAIGDLDAKRKHNIEAVVDRFRTRPDIAQRLAESFETALRLGNGIARLAFAESNQRAEMTFSSKHACPQCGYSVPLLEPKMFSFNNPSGACSGCDGLGYQQFFDPQRVVTHPQLSLAGGAIRGWDRRNAYYFQMVCALAAHYKFDIDTPWTQLEQAVRQVVLHGSGSDEMEFRYTDTRGKTGKRIHAFEGILPNLERRYAETESATVREELGKYRGTRVCTECQGARLNATARHVHVGEPTLPQSSHLSVGDAMTHFWTAGAVRSPAASSRKSPIACAS